ncbi:MAG: phospho-N-acetylmuramoyl-pentapeptide-transferase [Deltaproteobacteria bacterium]|nr:MAG: phospho-N-acetylmuramoyl-pentapeptide-transferase [Deltaproteobacteria bacterium]
MLYYALYSLHTTHTIFNVFRYTTFRSLVAALMALSISFLLGPSLIRRLTENQIGQPIRTDGPERHKVKAGTPTMGGTLILFSLVLATLLLADLGNPYIWLVLLVTLGFGAIGFVDDYRKFRYGTSAGLAPRHKFLAQCAVATLGAVLLLLVPEFQPTIAVPFFKNVKADLGLFYLPFAAFVIVGASNAVNLTDGLDGLAIGPVMIAAGTYAVFAFVTGNVKLAEYLQIPFVGGAGELAVFCSALAAAGLGFLWFNAYPAQMFMGDVGSLPLGAALAMVALITKHELVLVVVGAIFVVEALSVIAQVAYFRWTGGKRIFRMAPIHHHYELLGWPEPLIIVRFWIVSVICALVALSTLKLR